MMTVSNVPQSSQWELITIASTAPAFAQTNGERKSAARATAIRECNRATAKYPNYLWCEFEVEVYRACMAQRGQRQ
jgi:hypothetical protein